MQAVALTYQCHVFRAAEHSESADAVDVPDLQAFRTEHQPQDERRVQLLHVVLEGQLPAAGGEPAAGLRMMI